MAAIIKLGRLAAFKGTAPVVQTRALRTLVRNVPGHSNMGGLGTNCEMQGAKLFGRPATPLLPFKSNFGARGARGHARNSVQVAQATPLSTQVWRLVGAGSLVGLGMVALNGVTGSVSAEAMYPSYVSKRITSTYGYLAGGLGITAVTATYIFRSGLYYRLANVNPWVMLIGTAIGTIGSMAVCQTTNNKTLQHAAWLSFAGLMGVSMYPLAMVGGAILEQAAMGTGIIMGSISLVAATTRSDNHKVMAGPLTVGLGVVMAASLGQLFFPAMPLLYNLSLYGGLAVFGGLAYVDTQTLLEKAKRAPVFDPLCASLGVYLDTANIFVRMVTILANRGGQKRK